MTMASCSGISSSTLVPIAKWRMFITVTLLLCIGPSPTPDTRCSPTERWPVPAGCSRFRCCRWPARTSHGAIRPRATRAEVLSETRRQAKERFLSAAEIAAVVEGLDTCGHTSAADCLRLIMLTGCRPGEAMLATWAQFDAQPGFWIKPSSHTKQRKEHRLPLERACSAADRRHSYPPWRHQFGRLRLPGPAARSAIAAIAQLLGRSLQACGADRYPHLRFAAHFCCDWCWRWAEPAFDRALLGHTQQRTTQRYAHLADDPLREAADKIASAITKAGQGGKVVRLRGGGMKADVLPAPAQPDIPSWVPELIAQSVRAAYE